MLNDIVLQFDISLLISIITENMKVLLLPFCKLLESEYE